MKHSDIIAHLCHRLSTGDGINSALAEIGLTTDYLADHLTGPDRARLQQAHAIHRETLEKQLAERSSSRRCAGCSAMRASTSASRRVFSAFVCASSAA